MASSRNPFIWDRPLDDPARIVGMEAFANQVALTLKGQTNVSLFGPRDTGKTTFTNQLALELAKRHRPDAPPFDVVRRVNLQRVVSIPGFIGCVFSDTPHRADVARQAAQPVVEADLDEEFYENRIGKLTSERLYVSALAHLGDGPQQVRAIAGLLRRATTWLSRVRDELMRSAVIYAPRRGYLDFTVPRCAAFLRRHYPFDA